MNGYCDQCQIAEAYFQMYRPATAKRERGILELCGHHANEHKFALIRDGWAIVEKVLAQ